MLIRYGKVFVIIVLAASLGLQWSFLQTIAWTTMLANNLHSCSFHDAVVKTFDGKHPCCLCRAIAAAKQSAKKNQSVAPTQKLQFPLARENPVLFAPSNFQWTPSVNYFAASLNQKPPTPPPRCFPA